MKETIYVEAVAGKSSVNPAVYQFKVYRYDYNGREYLLYRSGFSYVSKESTLADGVKWCKANGYPNVETIN